MKYCANCDTPLMTHAAENTVLHICPSYSSIFLEKDKQYRFIAQLSGGNAAREAVEVLRHCG